jgi:hypothetical protein
MITHRSLKVPEKGTDCMPLDIATDLMPIA